MVKRPLLLLVPVLLAGCILFLDPDHTNPFDPQFNPPYFCRLAGPGTNNILRVTWYEQSHGPVHSYVVLRSEIASQMKLAASLQEHHSNLSGVRVEQVVTNREKSFLGVPVTGLSTVQPTYFCVITRTVNGPEGSNIATYVP